MHLCINTNDTFQVFLKTPKRPITISPFGQNFVNITLSRRIFQSLRFQINLFHVDLVTHKSSPKNDACMHSDTTGFEVNAFAPPHTIKAPIKVHYGFSSRSNRRENCSTACSLWARRCLLCCHPKELRLIRKLYDHNY